jgi:hypothetical protein
LNAKVWARYLDPGSSYISFPPPHYQIPTRPLPRTTCTSCLMHPPTWATRLFHTRHGPSSAKQQTTIPTVGIPVSLLYAGLAALDATVGDGLHHRHCHSDCDNHHNHDPPLAASPRRMDRSCLHPLTPRAMKISETWRRTGHAGLIANHDVSWIAPCWCCIHDEPQAPTHSCARAGRCSARCSGA